MKKTRRRAAWGLVAGVSLVLKTEGLSLAKPEDHEVCLAAHEKAQELHGEGKLTAERKELLICAQESCPGKVSQECKGMLQGLEKRLPSLVFDARGASGSSLLDVRVRLDGALVASRLDGKAIEVDPGPHTVRFELPSGQQAEQAILVLEGERARKIVADFRAGPSSSSPPAGSPSALPGSSEVSLRTTTYALAGLGGGVLVVAGVIALVARTQETDLQERCKTACAPESEYESMQRKYIAADVGAGIGLAVLGVAGYLWWTQSREPQSVSLRPALDPVRRWGGLSWEGKF